MSKTNKTTTKTVAPAKVAKAQVPIPKNTRNLKTKPAPDATPAVRLQLAAAGASSVAVAGSFNAWQPEPAAQIGDGVWVKELFLSPGRYEYLFVVDGRWQSDPNARELVPNPFGGQNSVLVVNG